MAGSPSSATGTGTSEPSARTRTASRLAVPPFQLTAASASLVVRPCSTAVLSHAACTTCIQSGCSSVNCQSEPQTMRRTSMRSAMTYAK